MERIKILRNKILEKGFTFGMEFYYLFYKEFDRLKDLSEAERYGEAFFYAFSNMTPSISYGELIVGKRDIGVSESEGNEWNEKYKVIAKECKKKYGGYMDSHMSIDYPLLLNEGIEGIMAKIDGYLAECEDEKKAFYKCAKRCLEAVIVHAENYADAAARMAEKETDIIRQKELLKISKVCRNVPRKPARSFYEAVQSVHFVTHCVSLNPYIVGVQQFQLGHPDRYLLPFYEEDIKNGKISKDFAQLLLDCLGIQINNRVQSGLSSGYMVGGRDRNGKIVENDLTYMCMQVVDDIRLVYPAVGLCYTDGMSDAVLEKACSLLLKGHSHPAIFNDDIITKGLLYYGMPEDEAHDYIHSTCVEITPTGASNVWVASPYTNLAQLLLDCMDKEYESFDDLINAYLAHLDECIKLNWEKQCTHRKNRLEGGFNPLLSCFVNDCLTLGLDIERGGAKYNWILPSFVGMANLVDSLYAIKQLVFEEKSLTIAEFYKILADNYENNEALRQRILKKIAKYGNDNDDIDKYFILISEHIANTCEKFTCPAQNGKLIPSVFCWIMHERFGSETGATPDGRVAHFPLGDGSSACQGREMNGPTASILSATKWDHHKFIGGVAVNLKFSKSSLGSDSLSNVKNIVKTYLERGGFELQINVVDNEILKAAQKNPENYRDLVVRIGGYSDYFVRLSPQMQKEVILRTAHDA